MPHKPSTNPEGWQTAAIHTFKPNGFDQPAHINLRRKSLKLFS